MVETPLPSHASEVLDKNSERLFTPSPRDLKSSPQVHTLPAGLSLDNSPSPNVFYFYLHCSCSACSAHLVFTGRVSYIFPTRTVYFTRGQLSWLCFKVRASAQIPNKRQPQISRPTFSATCMSLLLTPHHPPSPFF